ncbi:MAG: hypothetical protein A3F11_10945 [Gammaproteobacteria bacterium RIFCSPHIGHO2_12_FULL_37_14]|nr:MAG: hypothetical protein A3F11_10945 [Gammaproteobacteria bacterium RIFCSPHIGHO2_12_FULL_37_14]
MGVPAEGEYVYSNAVAGLFCVAVQVVVGMCPPQPPRARGRVGWMAEAVGVVVGEMWWLYIFV